MADYVKVYYKKFWDHAKEPTRATPYSAGSDLYSAFEYCLPAKGQVTVDTGIGVVMPLTHYGKLVSKSRLAHEHAIYVEAGAVDPDYTGPIFVILNNQSGKNYLIEQLEPIAQIIYQKMALPIYEEIQCIPQTRRGNQGLGVADTDEQISRPTSATTKTSGTLTTMTTTMSSTSENFETSTRDMSN